jgi:hypothetical protein
VPPPASQQDPAPAAGPSAGQPPTGQPPGGPTSFGPGSGTPGGAGKDAIGPRIFTAFRPRQRFRRNASIVVGAECNEPCRLSASGIVAGTGSHRLVRVHTAWLQASGRGLTKLRLRLSRTGATAVARALSRRRLVTVRVHVHALDAAGNAGTPRLVVIRLVG